MKNSLKKRARVGRLLQSNETVAVYELSTQAGWCAGGFDMVLVSIDERAVSVRTMVTDSLSRVHCEQVVLSREAFAALVATYRAYERREQRGGWPTDDDSLFLDEEETVPVNGAGIEEYL